MTLKLYLISVLFITRAMADTGLYCRAKPSIGYVNWEMCRTCNDASKKCDEDPPNECFCENIKINNPRTNKLIGGSDCKDDFCYVSQNSNCSDALTKEGYDPYAYALQEGWHHEKIFRSKMACKSENKMDNGNEEEMEGVRIVGDNLNGVKETIIKNSKLLDGKSSVPLVFPMESHEECKQECESRCGMCGAWSYNTEELECYLHTVNSCCGQKGKQKPSSGWISGYYCPNCWSTKKGADCPCSVKNRQSIPGCSIAQNNNGANNPYYTSPAGPLEVITVPQNEDTCACERRKGRRGKWRCFHPRCHDISLNPCGKCKDQRRCRIPRSTEAAQEFIANTYGYPPNCKV